MMSSAGATTAAAAQAAVINAIRCFGVVVTVEPQEFLSVVEKQDVPLIVTSKAGIFAAEYRYLMNYKGLTFYTTSAAPLELPADAEVVRAGKLYLPG